MNPTFQDIVNHFCSVEQWLGPTEAFISCPGKHRHTTPTGHGHTKIWLEDSQLRLKCWHQSCAPDRAKLFRDLGPAWELYGEAASPELIEARRQVREKEEEVKCQFKAISERVIRENAWPVDQILADSPRNNYVNSFSDWSKFLSMWDGRDRIWTGEPGHSGQLHHYRNFLTVNEWHDSGPKGRYTCPAVFKPATMSRALDRVLHVPYLVVEGDALVGVPETPAQKLANKNACGAIFKYLQEAHGLKLKAVVDTGNKSLHGWFVHPGEQAMQTLRLVIPALGCDKALLQPTQPVRLPGVLREAGGAMQEFIYFDPQVSSHPDQVPHLQPEAAT